MTLYPLLYIDCDPVSTPVHRLGPYIHSCTWTGTLYPLLYMDWDPISTPILTSLLYSVGYIPRSRDSFGLTYPRLAAAAATEFERNQRQQQARRDLLMSLVAVQQGDSLPNIDSHHQLLVSICYCHIIPEVEARSQIFYYMLTCKYCPHTKTLFCSIL